MTQQLPDDCIRLLRGQRGVIASWQAEPAGLTPQRAKALVRAGRWQRLHYGVYASFTGEPTRQAALWAAVLRAGPQSVLSHETAAELDGLVEKTSKLMHVTIPESRRVRPIAGFAIHRSGRIFEARHPGLLPPRTMIEETVLDLVEEAASFDDVVSPLARACQRRLTFPRDVYYRKYGVVVELDGRASHADRRLQDSRRDNAAAAQGIITLRYGWVDVTERPCQTASEVGQTLTRGGWPGSLKRCRHCRVSFP